MKRTEGFVDVGPGRVWYESVGEGPTLLLLHGGPGSSSDYLTPLMTFADEGFRVVRYDQLGSDKSDKPDDLSLWQVPRFVEEVETVRRTLDLGPIHLLGQSWGSFLALEYVLHHQDQLRSLVLYSGAASTAECVNGMNALRGQLPIETQTVLRTFEQTGETDHPDYLAAMLSVYQRHLCRLDPWPDILPESMDKIGLPVYTTMWGPNEFVCNGNLQPWDRTDRLNEITVPTLIVCGRFDEVVPSCSETMHRGIAGSELEILEQSSHLSHLEEPDLFFPVLRQFLTSAEKQFAGSAS
jgi:proline iminopeptidase